MDVCKFSLYACNSQVYVLFHCITATACPTVGNMITVIAFSGKNVWDAFYTALTNLILLQVTFITYSVFFDTQPTYNGSSICICSAVSTHIVIHIITIIMQDKTWFMLIMSLSEPKFQGSLGFGRHSCTLCWQKCMHPDPTGQFPPKSHFLSPSLSLQNNSTTWTCKINERYNY